MSFLYKNKQFLQFNHNANNLTETQANTRSHSINLSNITAKKNKKKHTANKKTRFRDKHPTPQKQPTKPRIFNLTNLKNCLFATLYKQHKTSKEATLFVRIRKRVPKIDKNVNTRIVIDRNVWERANKDASSLEKFYRTKDGQTIYRKMCAIDHALEELLCQGKFNDENIDQAIESIVFAEIREQQRKEEEERKQKKQAAEEPRKKDVRTFLDNFIAGIREGSIKHNGNTYSANTCKVWESFRLILERFHKKHPFTWESIDQRLVDKLLFMMEKEDYMPKSINKYLVCFRAMVGCAHKARFHNNSVAEKCFSKIRVRESDKAKEIYLNDAELQALYEMSLEGLDAQVRDVFLVGCYTCQRYSDYSALTANNFTTTARGNKAVRLIHFLR